MVLRDKRWFALGAIGLLALIAASLWHLRDPYNIYLWSTPFQGYVAVLPSTLWAATKIWTFWAIAVAIAGLILLKLSPELGLCDAVIGGAAATWIFSYLAGNLLGPIGLFRTSTIWLMLIGAIIWIAKDPPHLEWRPPTTGQKLAALACLLMMVTTLPLELGSPVSPYMDALNLPSSVQRILTFRRYLPFDNDPYGYWGPTSETPGAETLFGFLGLGAHMSLGVLTVTGAIVPMAALLIFATYRLGRSLMNDAAGGLAALLIFADTLLVRAQHMRGTPIAFALVAIGLAFLMDRRRLPIRTAIGALALGVAVPTQAIDGGFALATAGSVLLIRLFEDGILDTLREGLCLIGAAMVSLPEFAVALQFHVPYPVLPMVQLIGLAIVIVAARSMKPLTRPRLALADWAMRAVILGTLVVFLYHPAGIFSGLQTTFPMLLVLCLLGLLAALLAPRAEYLSGVYVAATALLLAKLVEYLLTASLWSPANSAAQFGVDDILWKLNEYWCPYFLIFPAAALFAFLYRNFSKPLTVIALLALLIFPWRQHPELDLAYNEHSLAEGWAHDAFTIKVGWWTTLPDHRWLQSPTELELSAALRKEIAAGRITPKTHIVHVTPQAIIWQDVLLHSLYTGVDDDLYVMRPDGDLTKNAYANSRMRSVKDLPAAMAKNPPYVVVYREAYEVMRLPPPGYDQIFAEDGIYLFRRHDLAPASSAQASRK